MLREILQLGACPNQEEEQLVTMTTTEALRLQLDNLQKEKQELEVRILKLSQGQPAVVASGVAKPGPTRALARASAHLALASEIDDDHMINLYSLQSVV